MPTIYYGTVVATFRFTVVVLTKHHKVSLLADTNETDLLDLSVHIEVDGFWGVGGGAGAHGDLLLVSWTEDGRPSQAG